MAILGRRRGELTSSNQNQYTTQNTNKVRNICNTHSRSLLNTANGPNTCYPHRTSSSRAEDSTKWLSLLLVIGVTLLTVTSSSAFETMSLMTELRPRVVIPPDVLEVQSFHGNQSHTDHFRLLQRDGDNILIGARNIVFNISTVDLKEDFNSRIVWQSTRQDSSMCFNKGKSESECQNYIRVLAKKSDGEFLVCGTNAYKPLCREYHITTNGSMTYKESNGIGKCPYDPRHNSTFVFAGGELYSGTVADFQGTIPLIFREPLKTDHTDFKQLNAPDFVHSFEHGDYVFFFLRETAVEYMNCGKRVYSRVARVCKNDRGEGNAQYQTLWTTFLKSRLNCSVPGEYPFFFDEIQSASDVVEGVYAGSSYSLVYAIFTTPPNSIPGSAICVFSMSDILDAFEGPFKQQETINSNWLPVFNNKVPEPRPGSCVENSRSLPEENLNFIKAHPLMDHAVPAFYGKPLLVKASFDFRFSKLAVDPQVPLITKGAVDVLFLATDTGVIFKMINALSVHTTQQVEMVVIEEIHLFSESTQVTNLQLAQQSTGETKLLVITDDQVKAIPLHRCYEASTCSACVRLQDPYCAWFEGAGKCGAAHSDLTGPVFQNVSSGMHYQCPKGGENNLRPIDDVTPVTGSGLGLTIEDGLPGAGDGIYPETRLIPPLLSPGSTNLEPPTVVGGAGRGGRGRGLALPEDPTEGGGSGGSDGAGRNVYTTNNEIGIVYSEGGTITGPVIGASIEGPPIYSAETLAIAVTTACVAALVIGFISGFLFSRKCRGDDYSHTYSDTPYLESKLNKCDNLGPTADPNMYTSNHKQFNNLVTNFNPKNINGKSNTNTTTTDIKPAKCAYI